MSKYWVQQQTKIATWVDRLGTDDIHSAIQYYEHCYTVYEELHRIIERTDKLVLISDVPSKKQLAEELAVEAFTDPDNTAQWLLDNFEIRRK